MFRPLRLPALVAGMLLAAAAAAAAGEIHAFVYHRFGDSRYPSTNIELSDFTAQLQQLRDGDWSVLTLGEALRRQRDGTLPARCAVLTVDDAFDSFLANGVPLLRRYGFPATLFVNSEAVGTPGNVSWDELRRLRDAGIEIGNQTATHPYLLERRRGESETQWRARVRQELDAAQDALRRHLGTAPQLFAYPYGEFDPQLLGLVREAGFVAAATQTSGVVAADTDRFALPRFPMGGRGATAGEFARKLALHALPVRVLAPATPVVAGSDLPPLELEIAAGTAADLRRLRCYVDGAPLCSVRAVPGTPGRWQVVGATALTGRRLKYNLTAPGGDGWYWFSWLWIRPERAGGGPGAAEAGDAGTRR